MTADVFHPPDGWKQVDANGYFTFWLPGNLAEQRVQGFDSYVGSWKSDDITVTFDYGMYSGGMDSTVKARPHSETTAFVSGHPATIVQYTDDSGLLVFELLMSHIDQQTNLSFDVTAAPSVGDIIPLQIVNSVRLDPNSKPLYAAQRPLH